MMYCSSKHLVGLGCLAPFLFQSFLLVLVSAESFDASSIGVCWGRVAWQPLAPRIVVKLLQDNKINKVKLFNADPHVMKALVGSKLEVTVMVANELLNDMAMNPKKAQDWVDYNVKRYAFPGGVDIRYVSVGNEPFLRWDNGEYNLVLAPAVQNIYDALKADGLDHKVKVTVAFNADVMGTSYPPSKASFRQDIANQMRRIVSLFSETGAPFSVNIYPFLNLYQQPGVFTMGDIFLDRPNERNFTDPGTGLVYTNVFDSTHDAILTALSRLGFPDLQVIIGEIGWPSDGQGSLNPYANNAYAQEFNNAIIQHMLSGSGTPLRPGKQIGGFIFGLLDEDMKSTLPGTFERHWGIFRADGTVKYNLDLTGKGDANAQLVPARDVAFFSKQWCVVKQGANPTNVAAALTYVCGGDKSVDCTPILPGSSCYFNNKLEDVASYAFNSYYQLQNQSQASCDFGGSARIVGTDPSKDGCIFFIGMDQASMLKASRRLWNTLTHTALGCAMAMLLIWFL
ncbi:hypothetical protein CLOM_g9597 [Closterium sp. NIES-68]|nr:hypothetical protein CLOM_g18055 [Closterium sp. NIES-68]GJP50463.1 hypothetical protein CLOM_g9597 [Closterium sp. NIES-68]